MVDIVVPVFRRCKVNYKAVGDAVLSGWLAGSARFKLPLPPKGGLRGSRAELVLSRGLTCLPSIELSLPPLSERMYGLADVGWMQVSLSASIFSQAYRRNLALE